MIALAALMRRAWMEERPTPPAPNTAALSPGCTLARLKTDPTPVTTPQAIRQAEVSGTSLSIGTACTSLITVSSANDEVAGEVAGRLAVEVKGSLAVADRLRHQVGLADVALVAHAAVGDGGDDHVVAGLDPGDRDPTASTIPAPSWPITDGAGHGMVPSSRLTSLWQTPAATIRTSTSSGPGRAPRRRR